MKANLRVETNESLAAISIMAATADGVISDGERRIIQEFTNELSDDALTRIYQRVIYKSGDVGFEMSQLPDANTRRRAIQLAKEVCESDGNFSEKERVFVQQLEKHIVPPVKSLAPSMVSQADTIPLQYALSAAEIAREYPVTQGIWLSVLELRMTVALSDQVGQHTMGMSSEELDKVDSLIKTVGAMNGWVRRTVGITKAPGTGTQRAEVAFCEVYALGCLLEQYFKKKKLQSAPAIRRHFKAFVLEARGLFAFCAAA